MEALATRRRLLGDIDDSTAEARELVNKRTPTRPRPHPPAPDVCTLCCVVLLLLWCGPHAHGSVVDVDVGVGVCGCVDMWALRVALWCPTSAPPPVSASPPRAYQHPSHITCFGCHVHRRP